MTTHATQTVRLILNNYEHLYRAFQHAVGLAWWDDEDSTWNDVDKAAKDVEQLARSLDATAPGMSDLLKIDYDNVDWHELIHDELEEANLQEGRARTAGLDS